MKVCDSESVRNMARDLGFVLIGVAPAASSPFEGYIRRWLDQGKHGQMAYLAKNLPLRLDPTALLPAAQSVICVADRYPADTVALKSREEERAESSVSLDHGSNSRKKGHLKSVGRIARYAWGNDYHRVIKKRLIKLADTLRHQWPDHQYKVAVDTAPTLEREHAQRAGLGWVGKHTLLIHPQQGSWLLLGQIVTTLPIQDLAPKQPIPDHCGTCTRCIDACPTNCITPYQLDAQRCISYLTIEHRGPIDPEMHRQMGQWIAGCDVCQEVCPYNQPQRLDRNQDEGAVSQPDYATRPPGPAAPLIEILNWDESARRNALRVSALKRIKLDMFKRNALIAAGNALETESDEALQSRILEIAADDREPEMVRLTARQVLERLTPTP